MKKKNTIKEFHWLKNVDFPNTSPASEIKELFFMLA